MIVNAHLNFFHITECGLYKTGADEPVALNIHETFEAIYNWLDDRSMEETLPWDPSLSRIGMAKCYRYDHYYDEDHRDFLFVLWKSDGSSGGSILGASADAKAGQSEVIEYTAQHNGRKMIWGHPAYYWVIPSLKTVVSIKFNHSVTDNDLFQQWVVACINNRVKLPFKEKITTDKGFVRFEFNDGDKKNTGLHFRFETKMQSLETSSLPLLELVSKITHLVKRETIQIREGQDDRNDWVKWFDKLPFVKPKEKSTSRRIEVRVEARPTLSEVQKIIQDYAREDRVYGEWDNIGFEKDDNQVIWVDACRLHKKIQINHDGQTVFDASVLHDFLSQRREDYLKETKNIIDELDAKHKAKKIERREKAKMARNEATSSSDLKMEDLQEAIQDAEDVKMEKVG